MIVQTRISLTLFSLALGVASLVACSGGATVGGNAMGGIGTTSPATTRPTGSASASASPVTSASPTSVASPTPTASAVVSGAIYHPSANGDAFAFAGTLTTTYARPDQYPTPEPTQTAYATVSQTITVTNPATFGGDTSAVDYHDVETDAQTAPAEQTTSTTTDAYFSFSNSIVSGNFSELGFTATQNNGYQVTVTFGAGNGLVDILPETAGTMWTNTPALTASAMAEDGTTSQETINSDGTYTENFVYPNVDAVTNTGTASDQLDGSGSYTTQDEGTLNGSGQTMTLTAPSSQTSSGTITETTSVAPSPDASGATPTVTTTTIPNWIPTGFIGSALATERDVDNGAMTVPAACALPAQFGTSANQLVQTKRRVDPTFGETETETVTTYVMQTVGPVCTQIADVTNDYYDYSGQSVETKETVNFQGTPQQITTIEEVVSLQSETLASIARRPEAARAAIAGQVGERVALAESRVIAAREIRHLKKMRAFISKARIAEPSRPKAMR